ncbi:MAG: DUF4367 domain-containing protein [Candidatus Eremiobacteraeota bacterium]|nr:DUF4367 domain-containing protein [Candidatus Eremiobacteraeota bacterium]
MHGKALATLALAFTLTGAAQAQDAESVLRDAASAPRHLSYAGQVESVEYGSANSHASIYRVEHRSPNLTRRWYLAPQALYGDSIITRATTSYDLDVRHHRIIVSNDDTLEDEVALDDNFALLSSNYRIVPAPAEEVAGRKTLGFMLINRHTGQMCMRVWIDKETHLVLERQAYASDGAVISAMRYDQISYTSNLPAQFFNVPKEQGFATLRGMDHELPSNDIDAVARAAGFNAVGPKYLPEGFQPISGDVSEIKGVRSMHLLYSDGIRTLSLFENARGATADLSRFTVHQTTVESHDARYVEDGPTLLMTWERSGLHFALVGDLSRQEMTRIAESVTP